MTAANVGIPIKSQMWQIPSTIYKRMAVSYAELVEKVYHQAPGPEFNAEMNYAHTGRTRQFASTMPSTKGSS
jgi:hypothetical protein